MTMVAALAITSASYAQQSECTFTSQQDSFTRNYDGIVRVIYQDGGTSVDIVNRRTGEVLDTVDFGGDRFGAGCRLEGAAPRQSRTTLPNLTNNPEPTSTTRVTGSRRFETINVRSTGGAPVTTRTSSTPNDTNNTTTTTPSRRGFPASAAISGLPN